MKFGQNFDDIFLRACVRAPGFFHFVMTFFIFSSNFPCWRASWILADRKCQKTTGFTSFFWRIGAMKQSGAKYSFSESTIANRKCQKTTGFISFSEHPKIVANQKCQKTTGFISFLEHCKSKMSKNARFYKLFGTSLAPSPSP